jgi:hypothetical protein
MTCNGSTLEFLQAAGQNLPPFFVEKMQAAQPFQRVDGQSYNVAWGGVKAGEGASWRCLIR